MQNKLLNNMAVGITNYSSFSAATTNFAVARCYHFGEKENRPIMLLFVVLDHADATCSSLTIQLYAGNKQWVDLRISIGF